MLRPSKIDSQQVVRSWNNAYVEARSPYDIKLVLRKKKKKVLFAKWSATLGANLMWLHLWLVELPVTAPRLLLPPSRFMWNAALLGTCTSVPWKGIIWNGYQMSKPSVFEQICLHLCLFFPFTHFAFLPWIRFYGQDSPHSWSAWFQA